MTDSIESTISLQVTPFAKTYLRETSRWGFFLAIMGFIFIGLLILGGFFAGSYLSSLSQMTGARTPFPGFLLGMIYVVMGVLYIFPTYYLYQFSRKMKIAIATTDSGVLESALENQKSLYKFMGILVIVILAVYIVIGGIALIAMFAMRPQARSTTSRSRLAPARRARSSASSRSSTTKSRCTGVQWRR